MAGPIRSSSPGLRLGGDFYQPPPGGSKHLAGRVTANNYASLVALRWLQRYAAHYDVRKISAFSGSFVGVGNNPFYLGHQAMTVMFITQVRSMPLAARCWIVACHTSPLPGWRAPTGWIGGWALAIPRGAPASAEAFEFIRWMCATPAAAQNMSNRMGQFSAYRKNPYYDTIQNDPFLSVFYQIVRNARHTRTLMPAQNYLMDMLDRGMDDVIYGNRDPQLVLDDVTAKVQQRLEDVLARVNQREGAAGPGQQNQGGTP